MSVWFAMGTPPTTADDSLYHLWLAQNWIVCLVPTVLFTAFFLFWLVHRIRTWNTGKPGSPTSPDATSCPLARSQPPARASEAVPLESRWLLQPQF